MSQNIILDTDPGVDDALAIAFACASNLPVNAMTCSYGNSTLENSIKNILTIRRILNAKYTVYKGYSRPIKGKMCYAKSHGDDGLGGFQDKNIIGYKSIQDAQKYISKLLSTASEKSISFVCIGPMTDIAGWSVDKNFINKTQKIIMLGGVFGEKGNISPYAEFNIYNDPYAFQKTLTFACDKVLIPINVCRKVKLYKNDFDKIKSRKIRESFRNIARMYMEYYKNDPNYGTGNGAVMYDLLAIGYLINSKLFKKRKLRVGVETDPRKNTYGRTYIQKGISNCFVVTDVKAKELKKLFISTINSANN